MGARGSNRAFSNRRSSLDVAGLSQAPQVSCIPGQYPICWLPVSWEAMAVLTCRLVWRVPQGPYRVSSQEKSAPKCPRPGLRQNASQGFGLVLGMQQTQRLSHCIEPNLRMASTEPSRVRWSFPVVHRNLRKRASEPAPRTEVREISRTVSGRANVLLHVPVDVLKRPDGQGGPQPRSQAQVIPSKCKVACIVTGYL